MRHNRRRFIQSTAGAVAASSGAIGTGQTPEPQPQSEPTAPSAAAQRLHTKSISIDALVYNADYSTGLSEATLQAVRESGATAAFFDISVSQRWNQERGRSFDAMIRNIAHWNEELQRLDGIVLALAAEDIRAAKRSGRFAVVYGSQDGSILDREVEFVRMFYDLGLRILQITHNNRNFLGNGYQDRQNAGLSDFGIQVIERMNELGMLIDLSHCGDKTTLEAIDISARPCVVTHTGCRALYRSSRNRTDEQIKAVARKGGVIGVFNLSNWLTTDPEADVGTLIDHIDHIVNIAGIDHVGFGSDRPMEAVPNVDEMLAAFQHNAEESIRKGYHEVKPQHVIIPELNSPRRLLTLTDGLLQRGYRSADVEKITGGNFLRVFEEVVG